MSTEQFDKLHYVDTKKDDIVYYSDESDDDEAWVEMKIRKGWFSKCCVKIGNIPLLLKLFCLVLLPSLLIIITIGLTVYLVIENTFENASLESQIGSLRGVYSISHEYMMEEISTFQLLKENTTQNSIKYNMAREAVQQAQKRMDKDLKNLESLSFFQNAHETYIKNAVIHKNLHRDLKSNQSKVLTVGVYNNMYRSIKNFMLIMEKNGLTNKELLNLMKTTELIDNLHSLVLINFLFYNSTTLPVEWGHIMMNSIKNIEELVNQATLLNNTHFLDIISGLEKTEYGKVLNSLVLNYSLNYDSTHTLFNILTNNTRMNTTDVLEKASTLSQNEMDLILFEIQRTTNVSWITLGVIILICFVVFLGLCVLFPCIGCSIYLPYKIELKRKNDENNLVVHITEHIAHLNLEAPLVKGLILKDPKDLSIVEKNIRSIVRNLKKFKPYIPQTLLQSLKEQRALKDSSSSKTQSQDDKSNMKTTTNSVSFHDISSKMNSSNGSIVSYTSRISSSHATSTVAGNTLGNEISLFEKNITMLFLDLENSHNLPIHSLQQIHRDVLTNLMALVSKNGGVFIGFIGDHFVASFNSISKCFDHQKRACETAFQLQSILSRFADSQWDAPCKVNMYIMNNTVLQGTLGNKKYKSHTTFSPRISLAYRLIKYNKILNHPNSRIIIDENVFNHVNMFFQVEFVDAVTIFDEELQMDKIERIYVLSSKKENSTDEWMYEVEQLEQQNLKSAPLIREAWENIFKGEYEMAKEKITEVTTSDTKYNHQFELDNLRNRLDHQSQNQKTYKNSITTYNL